MGAILPPDDDEVALQDDTNWRIIFAVQPFMLTVSIVLFYLLVRHDTPRFYI